MIYNYDVLQAAQDEFEDSVSWYRYRSRIAAENFIIEVEEGIETICSDPYRFKNTDEFYREFVLRKYPFTIVYYIDEPKRLIVIVAIYHQSREPKQKYQRP